MEGRTTFIVAHRLSTVRNVDRIVVMKKGKIVESGTYDELIEKKGEFFKLKNM
ncbi:putative multidrug resistance ABC transporter ATP-binding/permease protein YheH [compost metagenome]